MITAVMMTAFTLISSFRTQLTDLIAFLKSKVIFGKKAGQWGRDVWAVIKYAREQEKPENMRDPNVKKPAEAVYKNVSNGLHNGFDSLDPPERGEALPMELLNGATSALEVAEKSQLIKERSRGREALDQS